MLVTTKIKNATALPMKLVTKDQLAIRRIKMIEPGKHINLSSWDGIVSNNSYIQISYEVYPADRPDGRTVRATFLPIHVYDHSEIKIICNMETNGMVHLDFVPAKGFLQRMSIARWVKDLFTGSA